MPDQPLTYESAGVHIEEAQRGLRVVGSAITATHNANVLTPIGGYGAQFLGVFPDLARPVLVSSIDGVGTKTKVAAMVGDYTNIGRDIVHHSVNDILCHGARPLFFLDYFACSRLDTIEFEAVLRSASEACAEVGCALVGGETAEMPGVYLDGEIDVVGCIVGVVDADKRLPSKSVGAGDVLIGLASNGLHTNGFSLARRALFEVGGYSVRDEIAGLGISIGQELLKPHRCYYNAIAPLLANEGHGIHALAHITGGGFFDNIPRVLPIDLQATIDKRSWSPPPIFQMIRHSADLSDIEMYRTFNMGIGMVLVVDKDLASAVHQRLNEAGENAYMIGSLQKGAHDVTIA